MSEEITPVTEELAILEIPFRTFRHPGPVSSLEQAALEHPSRHNRSSQKAPATCSLLQ